MRLPLEFQNRMKEMLGGEYDRFVSACDNELFRGMRVNTLKTDKNFLFEKLGFVPKSSPFCNDSFYIPNEIKSFGNHPLHHAGAYYIQEPSAASAVEIMDIKEGDRVLDLCAAPGGKTTQIAAKLNGEGLIWSNEYVKSRTTSLISNIERMGIKNAVVSNTHPEELCERLSGFFNKILVDAPCSGEGMFRKEPEALLNWSVENSKTCGERQLGILNSAKKALRKGGILCYSTCTFSYFENEEVIDRFLSENPDFELIDMPFSFGTAGFTKYAPNTPDIIKTRHIFPQDGGEGHYIALMRKKDDSHNGEIPILKPKKSSQKDIADEFIAENFDGISPENVHLIGEKVYISSFVPDIKCGILRSGVLAGEIKGKRFEPSHNLYSAYGKQAKNRLNLPLADERVEKYLHGEEIECEEISGYTALLLEGIPLSFGKASNGRLKNHYPKGLRILK